MNELRQHALLACLMICILPLSAAENAPDGTAENVLARTEGAALPLSEIEQLKQMLADQQRQINELRRALAQQQKRDNDGSVSASAGTQVSLPAVAVPAGAFPNLGQV